MTEPKNALVEKIEFLYKNKNDLGIVSLIKNQPINLLVEALENIDDINIIIRFLMMSVDIKLGELFLSFNDSNQKKILETLRPGGLYKLLSDLNSDDIYEIFTNSPLFIQKKIIFNAPKEIKEEIKQLKSFDFGQIGSIMNTTFLTLLEGMNVGDAINYLRLKDPEFDIDEEIFVIDSYSKITGSIKIKNLLFSDNSTSLSEMSEKSFLSISQSDDIDEVIDIFKKYSVNIVGVLDDEERLVGIVNYQDVIPEILDSSIEDVYKFYGIREFRKSYLGSSVWEIVKSRLLCLLMMLLAATFTTLAIDKFEHLGVEWTAGLSSAILVPIIPIITDMCGNTGSQTAATVIQAVSAGELKYQDYKKVLKKELKVATVIGGVLALCNFLRLVIYFWIFSIDKQKLHLTLVSTSSPTPTQLYNISLIGALSSSLSLWLVVIFSKFFGAIIPLTAIKFGYDPSSVSSPILTTILDTVASIIFFALGVVLIYYAINPLLGMSVSSGKLQSTTSMVVF